MTPDRFYGLDIETDTTINGLDPNVAAVVAVAIVTASERFVIMGPERELLAATNAVLAGLEPGVLVTWNGARFDLPFLALRAERLGVPLDLELFPPPTAADETSRLGIADDGAAQREQRFSVRGRWGVHLHLDAFAVYRADVGNTLGLSCGLKALARFLRYEPIEVDRTRIEDLSPDELEAYVASDAELARVLALRRYPAILNAVDRPERFQPIFQ
ncbi:MAG: hypothetical protein GX868_00650 [Actinobacteria bacterium]|nr:hypothetical protein [Actinomycetota bacterium]